MIMEEQGFSISSVDVPSFFSFQNPYIFVDSIERVIPGVEAIGTKSFTWNEWFFPVHFPDDPMVPGNLIAEAMGQVLGFTVQAMEGNKKKKAYLIATDKFRLLNKVRPGDILRTEATVTSFKRGILVGHCKATANGKTVAVADISLLVEGIEVLKPVNK